MLMNNKKINYFVFKPKKKRKTNIPKIKKFTLPKICYFSSFYHYYKFKKIFCFLLL
jgi:hypothetical protein